MLGSVGIKISHTAKISIWCLRRILDYATRILRDTISVQIWPAMKNFYALHLNRSSRRL